VTSLERAPLAEAIDRLGDEEFARQLGQGGPALTADLTWDRVIDALIGET
jgi:hypothetical protein